MYISWCYVLYFVYLVYLDNFQTQKPQKHLNMEKVRNSEFVVDSSSKIKSEGREGVVEEGAGAGTKIVTMKNLISVYFLLFSYGFCFCSCVDISVFQVITTVIFSGL